MRVQKVLLSCLLSFVILFFSLSPAFAVTLPEPTDRVIPPKPNGAVIFPEGASDGIDWQGVTDDMWELLFTGGKAVDRYFKISYTGFEREQKRDLFSMLV